MNGTVRVLLGLSPPDEHAIEEVLYGSDGLNIVAGGSSGSQLVGLSAGHAADAVLLSHDLPGLDAGCVSRLRAKGLRTVGFAGSDTDAAALAELDVDTVVRPPLSQTDLLEQLNESAEAPLQPLETNASAPRRRAAGGAGNVLAVVGSKGTPGASELAASLASLFSLRWPVVLAELDGDGGQLGLRLDADPQQGSLLGLVRALRRDDPELRELLYGWVAGDAQGWPPALIGVPDPERNLNEVVAPGVTAALLRLLSEEFALVVCDVGYRVARAEEPDAAVRLHRDVLVAADAVVLVFGQRQEQLYAGFRQLELLVDELGVPIERLRVVVNGQAGVAAGAKAETVTAVTRELAERDLGVDAWLPWDTKSLRASVRLGVPFAAARPRGRYARTLRGLAESMLMPTAAQPLPREQRAHAAAHVTVHVGSREVALPWRR